MHCIDICIDVFFYRLYHELMKKKSQLQIRVSEAEKELIRAAASRAGKDMSTWILNTVLSVPERQFRELLKLLGKRPNPAVFAELIDLLCSLSVQEFTAIHNPEPELELLDRYLQNYVSALVEQRANQLGLSAPKWATSIPVLDKPVFGTDLKSLRPYLLTHSPVAFKRRNIFIDSALGDRV